jgi:hypothetical protein
VKQSIYFGEATFTFAGVNYTLEVHGCPHTGGLFAVDRAFLNRAPTVGEDGVIRGRLNQDDECCSPYLAGNTMELERGPVPLPRKEKA